MIYFLQPTDGGPIKCGHSDDVERRRAQLETHYGKPLALLATMPGGRPEEREIHERFASLRLGRTEQFRPAPELLAFIGRPLLVSPDPEAVEAMPHMALPVALAMRGTDAWAGWLAAFAAHLGMPATVLIDQAVREKARREGYPAPPSRTQGDES